MTSICKINKSQILPLKSTKNYWYWKGAGLFSFFNAKKGGSFCEEQRTNKTQNSHTYLVNLFNFLRSGLFARFLPGRLLQVNNVLHQESDSGARQALLDDIVHFLKKKIKCWVTILKKNYMQISLREFAYQHKFYDISFSKDTKIKILSIFSCIRSRWFWFGHITITKWFVFQ